MKKLTWMTVVAISFPLYLNPETDAKSLITGNILCSFYPEAAGNRKKFSSIRIPDSTCKCSGNIAARGSSVFGNVYNKIPGLKILNWIPAEIKFTNEKRV
jgi:hypothetical protein